MDKVVFDIGKIAIQKTLLETDLDAAIEYAQEYAQNHVRVTIEKWETEQRQVD